MSVRLLTVADNQKLGMWRDWLWKWCESEFEGMSTISLCYTAGNLCVINRVDSLDDEAQATGGKQKSSDLELMSRAVGIG